MHFDRTAIEFLLNRPMEQLRRHDFHRLLDCAADIYAHHDLDSFGREVLALVPRIVSVSYSAYNEFNIRCHRGTHIFDNPEVSLGPPRRAWDLLFREQPLIRHYQATRDGTARKLSDFISHRRYRETALYREMFRSAGVEYQMAFYLPERPPNSVAISLIRDRHDFTERDRLMLNLSRPHFVQAYYNAELIQQLRVETAAAADAVDATRRGLVLLNAAGAMNFCSARARLWLAAYFDKPRVLDELPESVRHWIRSQALPATDSDRLPAPPSPLVVDHGDSQLVIRMVPHVKLGWRMLVLEEKQTMWTSEPLKRLGLTERQAEVLLWVAQGKTNPEIGIILGLSAGTVHKHTEHIFEKLGVETRTAAARCAMELLTDHRC